MRNFEIKNNASLSLCGRGSQYGRSMIEMLGVLAIIGVLSVGGIAGYSKAMTKYRINKTIEQITLIAGNVRAFFASQRSYEGLNNSDVIKKAKLVPEEMIEDRGEYIEIINAFGGSCYLDTYDNNKSFGFSCYGISEEACIELLSFDWSATNANGAILCTNNGPEYDYYLRLPIDLDKAVTYCHKAFEEADSDDLFVLGLTFDLDKNSDLWKNTYK
ncbi:MAG: hypothetical protein IJ525_06475 [Alphaproteobacteria bacterium]|nr:hypothetical protein [Alphaproteobacteria bacterium]